MRRLLTILGLVGILAGCESVPCDESGAASSVTVSVFDASGNAYPPDDVTYSVDGGSERSCDDLGDGTEFVCGWDETGDFTITVYDGGMTWTEQVEVGSSFDGCHAQSEFVDIWLE